MTNELVAIEKVNALEVFSTERGLDPIIEDIKKQVEEQELDASTEEGRKQIASVARKIGSSKVMLEKLAMDLTEDWRKKTNAVNAEKKRMREELDSLRDEVKAPLDEYRQREAKRVEAHEQRIVAMANTANFETSEQSVEELKKANNQLAKLFNLDDLGAPMDWEEFEQRASSVYTATNQKLNQMITDRKKRDKEQAELERLRKEQAEREQKERDERIAKEAAEKARREAEEKAQREREEAEAKAKAEQERVEREKLEAQEKAKAAEQARIDAERRAKEDAERAEKERIASEKRAQAEKEAAIKAERDRQEAERKAEQEAIAKREADKAHKKKFNDDAIKCLEHFVGLDNEQAKAVIEAIVADKINHVKINY